MLGTVAVASFVLWALGMVTSYTMGGFIDLLLVLAIAAILIRVIRGRAARYNPCRSGMADPRLGQ